VEILQLPWSRRCPLVDTPHLNSQSHFFRLPSRAQNSINCSFVNPELDGRFWVWFLCYDRRSVARQLRFCWCGALSLTRGRICRLQLLLAVISAVILGSESRGTRNQILLSQIRDFPFRRLLWLAGLPWRYSTPPPHGRLPILKLTLLYNHYARTEYKTPFPTISLLRNGMHNPVVLLLRALHSNGRCFQSHCLATGLNVLIRSTVCINKLDGRTWTERRWSGRDN
jgi:hypothetical protein